MKLQDVPRREGRQVEFECNGIAYTIKCLGPQTWTLFTRDGADVPRCRFGNLKEIREDLATVLNGGRLPGKPGRP